MEREAFLQRIRTATQNPDLPVGPPEAPGGLVPDLSGTDLVERFRTRIEAVDGIAHRLTDDGEAIHIITGLLEEYEATDYLAWDADHLPIPGLLERLPGGPRSSQVGAEPSERLNHQAGYMDAQVGITGAIAGLAESGSIVLDCGPGRPRMASLIPLAHIALLRSTDISPSLSHWVAENPTAAADTSNLFVITGPSRTADIVQILNLGVHGPKHLHVILLPT